MAMKSKRASCGNARMAAWQSPCTREEVWTEAKPAPAPAKTLLETAAAAGQFTVLAKAIEAAGLTDLLSSKGSFTVFAPTDSAFSSVPQETLMDLLKPENQSKLRSVLRYHVVPGIYRAADVTSSSSLPTLEGLGLKPRVESGAAYIGNAKIVQTDIEASNGIIHVIDTVLLP